MKVIHILRFREIIERAKTQICEIDLYVNLKTRLYFNDFGYTYSLFDILISHMQKVLLYGDSLLLDLKTLDKKLFELTNACCSGMTIHDALKDQDKQMGISLLLSEDTYNIIIVCLGTNDLGNGKSTNEVLSDLVSLVSIIKGHKCKPKVFVLGFPHYDCASRNLKYLLSESQVQFVPWEFQEIFLKYLKEDELHLNAKGIKYMQTKLLTFLTANSTNKN